MISCVASVAWRILNRQWRYIAKRKLHPQRMMYQVSLILKTYSSWQISSVHKSMSR